MVGSNALFVSPDNLTLHHDLSPLHSKESRQSTYVERSAPSTHHQTVWASQQTQQSLPTLPVHSSSVPEWAFQAPTSFSANLPPTPIPPFRPLALRPLSEDERHAFPCTGTPSNCWNLDLCPKHRPHVKHEHQPMTASTTTPNPPEMHQDSRPNPRRRSAPVGDAEAPPAKMKRSATEPEEAAEIPYRYHPHTAIGRDFKSSLSKGRVPHNLVERRYRDNLNNQIEALRLTLPALRDAHSCTAADLDDASSPRMPSKAIIISTAATYIKDIETERTRLLAANTALQEQVSSLQKLMRCDDCNVIQYLNAVQLNHAHLPTHA